MTEQAEKKYACPSCHTSFDGLAPMHSDLAEPRNGDIAVCPACDANIQFREGGTAHHLTDEELSGLPVKAQVQFELAHSFNRLIGGIEAPPEFLRQLMELISDFEVRLFSGGAAGTLYLMRVRNGAVDSMKEFNVQTILNNSGVESIEKMIEVVKLSVPEFGYAFIAEATASTIRRNEGESEEDFIERAEREKNHNKYDAVIVRAGCSGRPEQVLVYRIDAENKQLVRQS